jgi:hypothetical protein
MFIVALAQPFIKVILNELVVGEMRIGTANSIDLLNLARRKSFVRIEAPSSFEQSLTPQNLV